MSSLTQLFYLRQLGLLLVLLNEPLGFDHLIQGNAAIRGSAPVLVVGGDSLELIGAMELGGSSGTGEIPFTMFGLGRGFGMLFHGFDLLYSGKRDLFIAYFPRYEAVYAGF